MTDDVFDPDAPFDLARSTAGLLGHLTESDLRRCAAFVVIAEAGLDDIVSRPGLRAIDRGRVAKLRDDLGKIAGRIEDVGREFRADWDDPKLPEETKTNGGGVTAPPPAPADPPPTASNPPGGTDE